MDYDYGDLHKFETSKWAYATPSGANPLFLRFVVQTTGRTGLLDGQTSVLLAKMAVSALKVDYTNYDVLGICMTEIPVGTQYAGMTMESGAYSIDVVFKINEWQFMYESPQEMASAANKVLLAYGIDGAVVKVAVRGSFVGVADLERDFWMERKPLYWWGTGEPVAAAFFKEWTGAGVLPENLDDQRAFGIGVASMPLEVVPLTSERLKSGKKVDPAALPVAAGSKPILLGASAEQLIVLGIGAFVGYKLAQRLKLAEKLSIF